jgi:hypothetical protein
MPKLDTLHLPINSLNILLSLCWLWPSKTHIRRIIKKKQYSLSENRNTSTLSIWRTPPSLKTIFSILLRMKQQQILKSELETYPRIQRTTGEYQGKSDGKKETVWIFPTRQLFFCKLTWETQKIHRFILKKSVLSIKTWNRIKKSPIFMTECIIILKEHQMQSKHVLPQHTIDSLKDSLTNMEIWK